MQNVRTAFTRGLSAVWTRLFSILFTILAALAVVGGISAFFISQESGHFVAFVLSFLLSFAALITGTSIGISAHLPRKLLVFTSIAALFSCFLLQTDPSVQTATRVALHGLSPGSLLTFGLVALAVISLLRSTFNWQNWFTWTEHIVAAGMAATCALLQLSLGESEPVPFLTSDLHPLATPFFQGLLLNQVLVLLLFLSAIIFLCHLTHAFSRLDRWLLCGVTLTFAWLQFSFGASEMLSLFPQLDEQLVTTTINPAIALAVVLIGLVLLRQYRQAWIGPTLILGLVVPYAFLQSFLVNQTVIPFLSASTQDGSSNPLLAASLASVVTWGLAIAALTLFARLTAQPNWADRLAVFIVAFSSALLQLSFGEGEEQFQLSPYHFEQSTVSLPQLIGFNRILVLGLVIVSIVVLVRWTHDEFLGRDRIVLIATPLSAALLQVFFGANEHIPSMISGNLIAAGLLGLDALIALFRLKQKFNGWDRFSLVLSAVCCLLLVGSNPAIQELPLLSTTLEQVTGNVLHVTTLNGLIVGFLFITAAISLFWLRRPFRPQDRKILLVMFGIVGGSALLGFIGFFLFIALLTLILAVIVAARMERVWG